MVCMTNMNARSPPQEVATFTHSSLVIICRRTSPVTQRAGTQPTGAEALCSSAETRSKIGRRGLVRHHTDSPPPLLLSVRPRVSWEHRHASTPGVCRFLSCLCCCCCSAPAQRLVKPSPCPREQEAKLLSRYTCSLHLSFGALCCMSCKIFDALLVRVGRVKLLYVHQ